jgi:benzoate-CoA ligase family protein
MERQLTMEIPSRLNVASWCLDRVADLHPDRLAVAGDPAPATYGELRVLANRVGNALRTMGCARGDRVLVALPDSIEFVAAFFGIIKIGAIAVPVNPMARGIDLAYYLDHSGARIAFVHAPAWPRVAAVKTNDPVRMIVVGAHEAPNAPPFDDTQFDDTWERVVSGAETTLDALPTAASDPALLLYTSGSTGLAKGALHEHKNMFVMSRSMGEGVLGIGPEDRTLSVSKLFFAYGLGNAMYFPLAAGASTVLNPDRPTLEKIAGLLARYRPTLFFAVPGVYRTLLKELDNGARFDFSSVRLALSAGEALPADVFDGFRERFGLELLDGLGSTEMLQTFICNRPARARARTCGVEVPNFDVRLMDESVMPAVPVAPGEIGTLWVKGASAFREYWKNPELTARTKVGEWVVTGDKLSRDQDGGLRFCGRIDDMLKVSGVWVSPVAVEAALMQHPDVERAVVLTREDSFGRRRLVTYVIMKHGREASVAHVRRHLRDHLPEHMAAECVRLAEIPVMANGKTDRRALLALSAHADSGVTVSG